MQRLNFKKCEQYLFFIDLWEWSLPIIKVWMNRQIIRRCYIWSFKIWNMCSTWFEQENGYLSHVEVNEVLGLVGNIWTEVSSDYTVPGGVVLLIKFLLDICSDIFFDVELFQGYVCAIDSILLHLFVHVGMLDDGFSLCGGHSIWIWIINKI